VICPTRDRLSDLLDGAVPFPLAWHLRRHIRQCAGCARNLQREEQLRDRVRSIDAAVTAPTSLRSRVAAVIQMDLSVPIERPHRLLTRRLILTSLVTCCLILGLFYLISASQLLHPTPAYSQVVNAMRQVKTARWSETSSSYDSKTGKSLHYTEHRMARLDPPALVTEYPPGRYRIRTPETDMMGNRITNAPAVIARQKILLRREILYLLAAPESLGKGANAWHVDHVVMDGQPLFRFAPWIGPHIDPEAKLTVPGYRTILWVNPATLRVVRSEQEYYDGQRHSRTVATDFEYDQPLPANIPLK